MLVLDFDICNILHLQANIPVHEFIADVQIQSSTKKNNVEFNCMFLYVVQVDFNIIFYFLTLVFDGTFKP